MVFCGLKIDGCFGLKFYRNETMNGFSYHSLLQYHVLPELRQWNGGSLATLVWQQDGAPCHVTNRNMQYLDSQFGDSHQQEIYPRKGLASTFTGSEPIRLLFWGVSQGEGIHSMA